MLRSSHLRVTAACVVIVALFAYPVAAAPMAKSTTGPAPEPGDDPCPNCTLVPTGPPVGSAEIYYQLSVRA
jgi:hypothetical protein